MNGRLDHPFTSLDVGEPDAEFNGAFTGLAVI